MNYLALGDSYTYGEKVPPIHSFPYILVQELRRKGIQIASPEVVAMTSWTSTELLDHMKDYSFESNYSFCTLLIGVNNQYRGLDISLFEKDLNRLCDFALHKVDMNPSNLILMNIPDWGLTPFNKTHDPKQVSEEINAYNDLILQKSQQLLSPYVDICTLNRAHANQAEYLVNDELHPSAKEYLLWAKKILTQTLNLG